MHSSATQTNTKSVNRLNPEQQAAVTYSDGQLLVLAGAGSGKTRVITEKIAFLIREQQVAPERIAAITFTNKAAKEMRQRAQKILRSTHKKINLQVSTFHAMGWKMLRQHCELLGYRPGISILDETESTRLLKELLPGPVTPEQLRLQRSLISRWKNAACDTGSALQLADSDGEMRMAGIYTDYQQQLQRINAVDFDDLISLPLQILRDEQTRLQWQHKLRYLLVDEYQDTNSTQYQLLRLLLGQHGNLTAVGDDDQSIYGWRGAEPENIRLLSQDFPSLHIIKLEQNYRCSEKILSAANQLIANNPHDHPKKLWSNLGAGDDIRIVPCRDGETEVQRIVAEIHQRIQKGAKPNEFAILYRSHYLARPFERALREANISYQVSGGQSFFDRAEIRDLMAYLRLLVNPDDNPAFLRIVNTPRREIGATTTNKLADYAGQHQCSLFTAATSDACRHTLSSRQRDAIDQFTRMIISAEDEATRGAEQDGLMPAIDDLLQQLRYTEWLRDQSSKPAEADKRIAAVEEWRNWLERLAEDHKDLSELAAQLHLFSQLDDDKADEKSLRMMTLHAAKGLEFPHVYLIGVEEGILPHQNSLDEGNDQEERRLMYVGITRAQRSLSISYCQQRKRYAELHRAKPSRFLDELPNDGIYWLGKDQNRDDEQSAQTGRNTIAELRAMLQD